jgi:hypothetical protein
MLFDGGGANDIANDTVRLAAVVGRSFCHSYTPRVQEDHNAGPTRV